MLSFNRIAAFLDLQNIIESSAQQFAIGFDFLLLEEFAVLFVHVNENIAPMEPL